MTSIPKIALKALPALAVFAAGSPVVVKAQPINDPRASTNDAKVLFRTECPGLFIPRVFEAKFQGLVPGYTMYVANKSNKRYTVKYDMLYTQRGDGVLMRGRKESLSEEKTFNIRPNTMMEFWLAEKEDSPYTIVSIDGIEVFECVGR